MKYTKKLLFTWIAFHGITDIFLCNLLDTSLFYNNAYEYLYT